MQLNWKFLQLANILSFPRSLEIVGYDFENIVQTQKLPYWNGRNAKHHKKMTQVEILKKEMEEVTNAAETKTRECIPLVDEREGLARELENAQLDIRKLKSRVRSEQTSKTVIQRRLEAINAQSPFSRPPNFYEVLFLSHGATISTIQKQLKMLAMLGHPDNGGREELLKIII